MAKNRGAFLRPILLFLVTLMGVAGFHPGTEGETGTACWGVFAAAEEGTQGDQDALLQAQYDAAQALFDAQEYEKAYEAFEALGTFSNSRARAAYSRRKWRAATYKEALALYEEEKYYEAKPIFESLEYYEKSQSYLNKCISEIKRIEYRQAKALFDAGDYQSAKALFESLGRYGESRELAQAADDMIKAQEQAAAELASYEKGLGLMADGDLNGARDAFIQAGDCKDATDQLYAVLGMMAQRAAYEKAEGYFANGEYENACDWFAGLGDYESSLEKAALAKEAWQAELYVQAQALKDQSPSRACILFLFLEDYKDSFALAEALKAQTTDHSLYMAAHTFAQQGAYEQAKLGFEAIPDYSNSQERIRQATENARQAKEFKQAVFLRATGEEEQANAIFESLGEFQGAGEMIVPLTPRFTAKQLRDDKTTEKSEVFTAPNGTKHRYQIFKGVHTWVEAKAFCEVLGGHLATLTTAEENTFVHTFMIDSGYLTAYFGLSDEAQAGDWIWVTGEPFDYSNWDPGEPSRSLRERYGMYFYKHTTGTWNDSHFYELEEVDPGCSYICEWDE